MIATEMTESRTRSHRTQVAPRSENATKERSSMRRNVAGQKQKSGPAPLGRGPLCDSVQRFLSRVFLDVRAEGNHDRAALFFVLGFFTARRGRRKGELQPNAAALELTFAFELFLANRIDDVRVQH